jgi:hypothetical protein
MEPLEILITEVKEMQSTTREMLSVNKDMLAEIKRQGDVTTIRLSGVDKEVTELKDANREIDGRLRNMERRCDAQHGLLDERQGLCGDRQDAEKVIGKWAMSAWGVIGGTVLGALGMRIAEMLF